MVTRLSQVLLSLLVFVLAMVLVQSFLALASAAQISRLSAATTLDRDLEPVVVKGVFAGTSVDQLFVYRELDGAWEQIPFQIDEVTASGTYTDTEDSLMDANDEIIFMAKDLGDKARTSNTLIFPTHSTWYEVEVTDPLSPTKKGWAYIVRSSVLTRTSSVDYADYIAASQRVSATNYTIGWATSHSGLNHQSLFGGGNILDRTKVRIVYTLILPSSLTEDDLPVLPLNLIKDGPVRVIVDRGAATTFAYASFMRTVTPVDLTSIPGTLNGIRLSTDLTSTITGTYYNENIPAGVTIDGVTETVTSTLSKAWRQVSLNSGTVIQVIDWDSIGGTPGHYYKDDSTPDPNDTGDKMSYGDSGFWIVNPISETFTVETVQYILPGNQDNRGDEYYDIFGQPLLVNVHIELGHEIHLPLILRNT